MVGDAIDDQTRHHLLHLLPYAVLDLHTWIKQFWQSLSSTRLGNCAFWAQFELNSALKLHDMHWALLDEVCRSTALLIEA
jgi:hypothetical protein